jgi:ubiquinone/menaquinone biosynthesis C-methylase UbiE
MAECVAEENEEALEAWNGPLFDRFVRFRETITTGLGMHGTEALRTDAPAPGSRVLDIGCGFGDESQRLARIVGDEGSVLGVDVAGRFVEAARAEAAAAGVGNVAFEAADVQVHDFDERFDYAFSRFGTMFFANPVAAMRKVRAALVPGGRLCMLVWRRKADNDWMHRAELIVKGFLERPEHSEEPTCGPGPFSMADADMVSDVLTIAGFEAVALRRCDIDMVAGRDFDEAIELVMAIGPGGEVLRLLGADADAARPRIEAALREGMAEFVRPDGVVSAPSSTWVVTARAPA